MTSKVPKARTKLCGPAKRGVMTLKMGLSNLVTRSWRRDWWRSARLAHAKRQELWGLFEHDGGIIVQDQDPK